MPPLHRYRPDLLIARPHRRHDCVRMLRQALAERNVELRDMTAAYADMTSDRNRWRRMAADHKPWFLVLLAIVILILVAVYAAVSKASRAGC